MIKRNRSDCKYIKIFTHHVGCIGAPSRRTVFVATKIKKGNFANKEIPFLDMCSLNPLIVYAVTLNFCSGNRISSQNP
jgi:hypothetical protein